MQHRSVKNDGTRDLWSGLTFVFFGVCFELDPWGWGRWNIFGRFYHIPEVELQQGFLCGVVRSKRSRGGPRAHSPADAHTELGYVCVVSKFLSTRRQINCSKFSCYCRLLWHLSLIEIFFTIRRVNRMRSPFIVQRKHTCEMKHDNAIDNRTEAHVVAFGCRNGRFFCEQVRVWILWSLHQASPQQFCRDGYHFLCKPLRLFSTT